MADLKKVYTAVTGNEALENLAMFKEKWGKQQAGQKKLCKSRQAVVKKTGANQWLVDMAQEHGFSKNAKSLPTQPNALSRRLNDMKSNLEAVGIMLIKDPKPKSDGSYITLINKNISPLPSYRVDSGAIMGLNHGDANGGITTPRQLSPYENPLNGTANGGACGNGANSKDSEGDEEIDF